jgi:hypothetical protein
VADRSLDYVFPLVARALLILVSLATSMHRIVDIVAEDESSAQCLVQIRDKVIGILNPDRNANKPRRDTQP